MKIAISEENLGEKVSKDIEQIFLDNQEVDWLKRQSIISRIKIQISKILINNNYEKEDADKVAKRIIDKAIHSKAR